MVHELTPDVRAEVIKLWLAGYSFREIHAKTGVSLGTISSLVNQEKTRTPDIEHARKLILLLKKRKSTLQDALRGAMFLERLDSLNIKVSSLQGCIRLLDQYGEKAGEVLKSAIRLSQLEESQGKTYDQILEEAINTEKQLEHAKGALKDLEEKKKKITRSLQDLELLRDLNERLRRHNLTPQHLDAFIEQNLKLGKLGFTPVSAELLAGELAKTGSDPQTATTTLTHILTQHKDLESAISSLQIRKTNLEEDIKTKKTELDKATKELDTTNNQVNHFKQLIKDNESASQAKMDQLEKESKSARERLSAEVENLKSQREEAQRAVEDLRKERDAIKSNIDQAHTAIAEIQERIAGNRRLATLVSLINEPRSPLEQTTVIEVAITIIQGIASHLRAHHQLVSNTLLLTQRLDEIAETLAMEHRLAARKTQ